VLKRTYIILLTIFFVCTATGVINFFAAKESLSVICDEDCGNNNNNLQEILDDIEIENHHEFKLKQLFINSNKTGFFYHAQNENEISVNLISPPPELV
jgi:hypothetical protein